MRPCGGLLNALFRKSCSDRFGHTARLFAFDDAAPRLACDLVRQPFDTVAAAPGIDYAVGICFLLKEELRIPRQPFGKVAGQGQRLIQGIAVHALGMALRGGHRLDTGANHVVIYVLRRQRPTAGLAVGPQVHALGILGRELLDDHRPEQSRRTHFGDFHKEILADRPEERDARGEGVDVPNRR